MTILTYAALMALIAAAHVISHDIKIYQQGPTSPRPPETPKGMNGPSEYDIQIKEVKNGSR